MAGKRKTAAAGDDSGGKERGRSSKTQNKKLSAAASAATVPDPAATTEQPVSRVSKVEEAYLQWMAAKGVKLRGVSIGRFPRTGRGCIATHDLNPGDVVNPESLQPKS
jgi:SET domain-containing protein 6